MATGQEPQATKIAYQSAKQSQAALESIDLVVTDGVIGTKISAQTPSTHVGWGGHTFISTEQ